MLQITTMPMFALLLLPVVIAHQQRFLLDSKGSGTSPDPSQVFVRLVEGRAANEGRVEVYEGSEWGTICSNHWNHDDAAVICSMLGYNRTGALTSTERFTGGGSGHIWLDEVRCQGTEKNIATCPANDWGQTNCSHAQDASVRCQTNGLLDNFLLITDYHSKISRMDAVSQSYTEVQNTSLSQNPADIDYDPIDARIYWTDVGLQMIKSASIDGTAERIVRDLGVNSKADGLAVDPSARLIFYTDTGYDHIATLTLDGSTQTIVINTGLEEPRAIVLDVNKRIMYWTDWGTTAKIESANYDGSNRHIIIQTGIVWPNGLALDSTAGKLYWADGDTNRIEVANLDGSDRRVLLQEALAHYFGLSLYQDTLYFTDWRKPNIRTLPTSGGIPSDFGPPGFERLSGIHYYKNEPISPVSPPQVSSTEQPSATPPTLSSLNITSSPIPTNVTTVTPSGEVCRDKIDTCSHYGKVACTRADYQAWANHTCALYCGFCTPANLSSDRCVDKVENCNEYDDGSLCTAPQFYIWAYEKCKLYCRFDECAGYPPLLVTSTEHPSAVTPHTLSFYNSSSPIPTNTTTVAPSGEVCRDKIDTCSHYGKVACTQTTYEAWARDKCALYCGFCPPGSITTDRCFDKVGNCNEFDDGHLCTAPQFYEWAYDNCKLYCKFDECNETECEDNPHFNCQDLDNAVAICTDVQKARNICKKFCNLCPIRDCMWNAWSDWSGCDVTCGSGHTSRNRTSTPARDGGLPCNGSALDIGTCTLNPCPVHGGWSSWNTWSACSVDCGVGLQRRDRNCSNPRPDIGGHHCYSEPSEYKTCVGNTCPNGTWSTWSEWSNCNAFGRRTRRRACTNPTVPLVKLTSCPGTENEEQVCNFYLSNEVHCVNECTSDVGGVRLCSTEGRRCSTDSGRVEVFHNETWASVCYVGWAQSNTDIVCQMFGSRSIFAMPTHHYNGTGLGVLSNVTCLGTETSLQQCMFNGWIMGNSSCPRNNALVEIDCL